MNTNIYHTTKQTKLQSAVRQAAEWSEFTYKDDPDYNAFCSSVRKEVEREGVQRYDRDGLGLDSVRLVHIGNLPRALARATEAIPKCHAVDLVQPGMV